MYIYTLGFVKYYILLILPLIAFNTWGILKWYDKLTLSYLILSYKAHSWTFKRDARFENESQMLTEQW